MERLIPWLLLAWMASRPARSRASPPPGHGSAILHQTPGRLRLRLSRHMDIAGVERALVARPAIHETSFNPLAHTLLVRYDPVGISHEEILALCQVSPSASVSRQPPASPPLAPHAGELFGRALFDTFARQTIERSVFTMVTTVLKGG